MSVSEIGARTACQLPVPFTQPENASGSKTEPLNRFAYASLTSVQLELIASDGREVMYEYVDSTAGSETIISTAPTTIASTSDSRVTVKVLAAQRLSMNNRPRLGFCSGSGLDAGPPGSVATSARSVLPSAFWAACASLAGSLSGEPDCGVGGLVMPRPRSRNPGRSPGSRRWPARRWARRPCCARVPRPG